MKIINKKNKKNLIKPTDNGSEIIVHNPLFVLNLKRLLRVWRSREVLNYM